MNDLKEQAYRHVAWVLGDHVNGYQPGGFTTALLSAWERADPQNNAKLCQAFPELGEAISIAKSYGTATLVKILKEQA